VAGSHIPLPFSSFSASQRQTEESKRKENLNQKREEWKGRRLGRVGG